MKTTRGTLVQQISQDSIENIQYLEILLNRSPAEEKDNTLLRI